MFEKFPSIEQYHHIVKELSERSKFVGKDENGKAIYDKTKPLPTINFMQTVKINGTNRGVILFKDGTIRTQSHNRGLRFNEWVAERSNAWREIAELMFFCCKEADKIVVYGEFTGKSFYVFDVAVFKNDEFITTARFDKYGYRFFEMNAHNIYSIFQFPHQQISIDLNHTDGYIPQLQEIALANENEGVVFTAYFEDKVYRFKVKGEKKT